MRPIPLCLYKYKLLVFFLEIYVIHECTVDYRLSTQIEPDQKVRT